MLALFLNSKSRAEIMRILFDGDNKELYLRAIVRETGLAVNAIQKEVKHLTTLEIISSRKDGNRVYYIANKEHPFYLDLVSIVKKSTGIVPILKERLVGQKISCAFMFGSMARGTSGAKSDIDLVVIGDIGMRALSKILSGLETEFSREINPHIFTEDEFRRRIEKRDHFVTSILKERIEFIIGNLSEYKKPD